MEDKTELIKLQNLEIEYTLLPNTESSENIIFINGLNDPFQNHLDILQNISAKGFNVYALNLPGHGKSQIANNLTWELLINLVEEFSEKLQIQKAYLIGYSIGAAVAYQAYEKNLQNFSGVTLWAPLLYSFNPLNVKTLIKAAKFLLHLNKSEHYNKPHPYPRMVKENYLKYLKLVNSLELKNFKEVKNLLIVLNEKDELIDNTRIVKLFNEDENKNNITILPNLSHQIYYIDKASIGAITAKLLPSKN